MKDRFKKIGSFIIKHKWSIGLITLSCAVGGFFIWDTLTANYSYSIPDLFVAKEEKIVLVPAPFSGIDVSEEQAKRRPLAVVIENSPKARPHSGLLEADIVFETLAEGGITRFLAIYQSQESEEIGPVRSARPYFVDWALGYDAIFAHVGGSEEALNQVVSDGVADLNQFYNGSYFWRSTKRLSPHNVYTTTEKLREAAEVRGYSTNKEDIIAMSFKEDALLEERPEMQSFKVNINYNYGPIYTFEKGSNTYLRSFESGEHMDTSGKQVAANNVIVMFADMGSIKLRNSTYTTIETVDSGKAYYYLDGNIVEGTWSRASQKSQIKFYGADGSMQEFNKGTTWINVVPQGTQIK